MKLIDERGNVLGQNTDSALQQAESDSGQSDIIDSTQAEFAVEVIEESMRRPVLVDFWAPWCGPCKQLTPLLEREVTAVHGAVRLVKIDMDSNRELAAQLQIRSIPAVFAFLGGAPVDGFMGVQSEDQLKRFIESIIEIAKKNLPNYSPPEDNQAAIADSRAKAKTALQNQDTGTAISLYQSILMQNPEDTESIAGIARCYLQEGQIDQAEALLKDLDDNARNKNPEVRSVIAAIELARVAEGAAKDNLTELQADLEKDPDSAELHFQIGRILVSQEHFDVGFEHLLTSLRIEKSLEKRQAHSFTLKVIESLAYDPAVADKLRRRLSSTLFS